MCEEYEKLLTHLNQHNLKEWLLKGCVDEDARTVMAAVRKTSSHRLRKGLARILSEAVHD